MGYVYSRTKMQVTFSDPPGNGVQSRTRVCIFFNAIRKGRLYRVVNYEFKRKWKGAVTG